MGGVAIAGGLTGLVTAGPIVGLLATPGAAVAATTKSGAGIAARVSGDSMASFGERLKEMDEKHHMVERISWSTANGARYVSKRLNNVECDIRPMLLHRMLSSNTHNMISLLLNIILLRMQM